LFRGNSPKTSWQRVFGGQVIGQAMVAACRTVEGRLPHSLHCYFILPGDPLVPIIYQVERLRDGRSYSTRRVTAIQHGNAIFSIMVSFHAEEEAAFDHQSQMPDVPPPKSSPPRKIAKQPTFKEMPEFIRRYYEMDRPIELRPVEIGRISARDRRRPHQLWIRTAAKLPDDPACICARWPNASDFSLLDAIMARHGRTLFEQPHDSGQASITRLSPAFAPTMLLTAHRRGARLPSGLSASAGSSPTAHWCLGWRRKGIRLAPAPVHRVIELADIMRVSNSVRRGAP